MQHISRRFSNYLFRQMYLCSFLFQKERDLMLMLETFWWYQQYSQKSVALFITIISSCRIVHPYFAIIRTFGYESTVPESLSCIIKEKKNPISTLTLLMLSAVSGQMAGLRHVWALSWGFWTARGRCSQCQTRQLFPEYIRVGVCGVSSWMCFRSRRLCLRDTQTRTSSQSVVC